MKSNLGYYRGIPMFPSNKMQSFLLSCVSIEGFEMHGIDIKWIFQTIQIRIAI